MNLWCSATLGGGTPILNLCTVFLFILCLAFIAYILLHEPNQLVPCLDILLSCTKEQIARWYGVTRPTFSKWIRLFTHKDDFPNWTRCKKVQGTEVIKVLVKLGNPLADKSLTRGQIATLTESCTGTLRANVELNAKKLGFGLETYNQVTIYPPSIAQRIIGIMG